MTTETPVDRLTRIAQQHWLTDRDRRVINKAVSVVLAAKGSRDDLAKYLVRLDAAVKALDNDRA